MKVRKLPCRTRPRPAGLVTMSLYVTTEPKLMLNVRYQKVPDHSRMPSLIFRPGSVSCQAVVLFSRQAYVHTAVPNTFLALSTVWRSTGPRCQIPALSFSFVTALIDHQGTLRMDFPGRISYHFSSQVETLLNRSIILLQEPRSPDTILGDLSCRANHFVIQGLCVSPGAKQHSLACPTRE